MKYKILTTIAAVGAAWALSSCDDGWNPNLTKEGTLSLSSLKVAVSEESRGNDIDVNNFLVEVLQNGEIVAGPYAFSKMPEVVTLPVGDYTIQAESHEQEKAAWEAPYFLGSKSFSISENAISSIGTVTCYFSNVKVTITYTDEMKKAMGDDCKVVVVANDEGNLTFTKDEERSGYFQVVDGSMTMVVTFSGTVDGNSQKASQTYTNVTAGKHYQIQYSLKNGNTDIPNQGDTNEDIETGSVDTSGISINIDTTTIISEDIDGVADVEENDEVIDVTRPTEEPEDSDDNNDDPDDPGTGDDPEPDTDAFTITSDGIDLDGVNGTAEGTYIVYLNSEYSFANLKVVIDSETLTDEILTGVGLTSSFDLAYPGDYEAGLQGLGFPTGDEVIGAKSVTFNISQFIPLLNIYGSATHKFILTMIDQQGNTEVLTLTFQS